MMRIAVKESRMDRLIDKTIRFLDNLAREEISYGQFRCSECGERDMREEREIVPGNKYRKMTHRPQCPVLMIRQDWEAAESLGGW